LRIATTPKHSHAELGAKRTNLTSVFADGNGFIETIVAPQNNELNGFKSLCQKAFDAKHAKVLFDNLFLHLIYRLARCKNGKADTAVQINGFREPPNNFALVIREILTHRNIADV